MKQTVLSKSARLLSLLLTIGSIIFGTFSILLLIGIIVLLSAPLLSPEMFQGAWEAAVHEGQTLRFGQCVFFFICCLGELVCIFLALYHAKRIFSCIGKGSSPFIPETATKIRRIALCVLLFAVFSSLSVFKMLSFPSILICGIFVLILFCISLIFDYGCELQREVDETL